jgi:hypothetical protein
MKNQIRFVDDMTHSILTRIKLVNVFRYRFVNWLNQFCSISFTGFSLRDKPRGGRQVSHGLYPALRATVAEGNVTL